MEVGVIGAGSMAEAIVAGLGMPVGITDSGSGRAAELAAGAGGEQFTSNTALAENARVLFLCHKPSGLDTVATEIGDYAGVLVSVLAATSTDTLTNAFPGATILRVMPNLPAETGAGVICIAGDGSFVPAAAEAIELLSRLGRLEWVDEDEMELATAIGGCAPAFYALFAERLARAAEARGMAPEQAARIACETLAGTGSLLRAKGYDTGLVQRAVASPGGLTERALQSFDADGLEQTIERAVAAVLGEE